MSTQLAVVVGDVINDVIVRPSAPISTGTDTPAVIKPAFGGSGANLAAWMGSLGAAVRFVGRAGAGDAAEQHAALEAFGVDTHIAADDDHSTGSIVVLVDSETAERTMLTDRGASAWLGPEDLPLDILDDAELLHVSGYAFFSPVTRPGVLALWEAARSLGIARSIDPSSVTGLRDVSAEAFLGWTEGATFCFPNFDEGRLLTGEDDPELMLDALAANYNTVALTLGADGLILARRGDARIRLGTPVPAGTPVTAGAPVTAGSPVTAGAPTAAVDSTGAGDALCAGVLAAWLDGRPSSELAAAGIAAAARAMQAPGGRPPLASFRAER